MTKTALVNSLGARVPDDRHDFASTVLQAAPAHDPFVPTPLAYSSPALLCASIDWHLLDKLGKHAAARLQLAPTDSAQFRTELRSRLLALLPAGPEQAEL